MTFMKGLPLLLLVASLCSHAALQPDRTRIVFNANDKATSLRVDNRSDNSPTSLIPGSKMKKGRKAMIFWSPCRRYNVWNRKQQRRYG